MIDRTAQCLELLERCKIPPTHKKLVRRNIMETKKLLLQSPATAAKVNVFAKERLETLLADMQRFSGVCLKAAEIYALVGGTNTILKIARLVAQEEHDAAHLQRPAKNRQILESGTDP